MMRIAAIAISACAASILLCACGTPPREYFYTLQPVTLPSADEAGKRNADLRVAVGPVKVPEIFDRPELVIRASSNRVELLEQHRWAQSLQTAIAHVLATELAGYLGGAQVSSYGDYASRNADYRILIDVERFDAIPAEAVTVKLVWSIRATEGNAAQTGSATASELVHGGAVEDLVAAYDRAIASISVEIGRDLLALRAAARR
jgi:uncharacterized lipoprotein YmbA